MKCEELDKVHNTTTNNHRVDHQVFRIPNMKRFDYRRYSTAPLASR